VAIHRNLDPAFASTDDIMAAAGVARRTVQVWVESGFLPPPLKVSLGMPGGVFNRFPVWAVERARFIAAKRAGGFTNDEVQVMLDKMDADEIRKAKAEGRPPNVPAKAEERPPSAPVQAPARKPAASAKKPSAPAKAAGRSGGRRR